MIPSANLTLRPVHRRWRLLAAALLPLLLGLSACGDSDTRPNVVVIVIDTLRVDHLPSFGYPQQTAPFLTELAETRGAYARTFSTSSWTAPATASLLTSTHPVQHGVLSGFRATEVRQKVDTTLKVDRIPDELVTMAEAFQEAGYETFGVADNRNICREMGFDQGFERFVNMSYEGADAVNARVMAWAEAIAAARPYFLYLHYMDPHRPYNQHDPDATLTGDERLDSIAAYDSEIAFVDSRIRALHEALGWDENTVIVVTSDHGEEFLEHGAWDHGRTLYGEVLDVPLIAVFPDSALAGGAMTEPVSLLDVLPTVYDYVGVPITGQTRGRSLLRQFAGRPLPEDRWFFADLRSAPWFGNQELQSVIHGRHKLVVTRPGDRELYDLVSDPREQRNLIAQRADIAEELWAEYEEQQSHWELARRAQSDATLTPDEIKKLRSLGYVQ